MSNYLFVLNDSPYGTERSYNGIRLANEIGKQDDDITIRVFLVGDAVVCAKADQQTPDGYYNIERMLKALARKDAEIGVCGSCMDARGLSEEELLDGTYRSSQTEWGNWTTESDEVMVF